MVHKWHLLHFPPSSMGGVRRGPKAARRQVYKVTERVAEIKVIGAVLGCAAVWVTFGPTSCALSLHHTPLTRGRPCSDTRSKRADLDLSQIVKVPHYHQ